MSKIERWLPFKFRRKSREEKQADPGHYGSGQPVPISSAAGRVPSSPLSPFFSPAMQHFFDSFFNDPFFRDPFARFGDLDRWFGDYSPSRFQPSIDVTDEEDAICVTAELPGISKDDIQLHIEGEALIIRGEKKHEEEKKEQGVYRAERYYGYFERVVPLPSELDHAKAEALFDKGVLRVRLPKLPESPDKTRRIPVH